MRKTSGFAQIAQNSYRFMRKNSQKNISGFAQIAQKKNAQNRAKLIAFHAQKLRKSSQKKKLRENSANFAQKI